MEQHRWFDRKFDFNFSENIFPSLLERLEATPLILEHKVNGIDSSLLIDKPGGAWSVLEQIGHLTDLEPLWQDRITNILQGAEVMAAADLDNKKTLEAGHNAKTVNNLLQNFSNARYKTIEQFKKVKEDDVFRFSLHPRLLKPMRMIDLALFVAEHDAHHLSKITQLLNIRRFE